MELTGADMIAAYRHDRTMEGFKRGVYTLVYNWLIGILFGWPHRDINFRSSCEARGSRRSSCAQGSLIDAELVVKAKNRGFVIQQIGIDYFPRTRGVAPRLVQCRAEDPARAGEAVPGDAVEGARG
jgi:hypothetical protein